MNVFDVKDILDKFKLSTKQLKWIISILIVLIPLSIYLTSTWNSVSTEYEELKATTDKNTKIIKRNNKRFDSIINNMNKNYYLQLHNLKQETNKKFETLIDNFDAKMTSNNKTLLKTAITNINNVMNEMMNNASMEMIVPTNSMKIYSIENKKIFDTDSIKKSDSIKDTTTN